MQRQVETHGLLNIEVVIAERQRQDGLSQHRVLVMDRIPRIRNRVVDRIEQTEAAIDFTKQHVPCVGRQPPTQEIGHHLPAA